MIPKGGLILEALRSAVHGHLLRESHGGRILVEYAEAIQSRALDPALVDVVHQMPGQVWTIYEAMPVAAFHSLIRAGEAIAFRVDLGTDAFRDQDRIRIRECLSGLPKPFSATFVGGSEDSDGYLWWAHSIALEGDNGRTIRLAPRKVPLEIGYTLGASSLTHLRRQGGLARWPYGSRYLHVVVEVHVKPAQTSR